MPEDKQYEEISKIGREAFLKDHPQYKPNDAYKAEWQSKWDADRKKAEEAYEEHKSLFKEQQRLIKEMNRLFEPKNRD